MQGSYNIEWFSLLPWKETHLISSGPFICEKYLYQNEWRKLIHPLYDYHCYHLCPCSHPLNTLDTCNHAWPLMGLFQISTSKLHMAEDFKILINLNIMLCSLYHCRTKNYAFKYQRLQQTWKLLPINKVFSFNSI